jgi:magnesium transporter
VSPHPDSTAAAAPDQGQPAARKRRRASFFRSVDAAALRLSRAAGLRLPRRFHKGAPAAAPGVEPGELACPPGEQRTTLTCIDYGPDQVRSQEVTDPEAFLALHRPEWCRVRWINVDGLSDAPIIRAIALKYELHPLAIEDVCVHLSQRPKVEAYGDGRGCLTSSVLRAGDLAAAPAPAPTSPVAAGLPENPVRARLFVVCRMIELLQGHLHSEQISIFLGHKTVLTFQETRGDVWDPIRARIGTVGSRLRQNDASFLVYSLIDAIVDHCFPILEQYGDRLEDLEDLILQRPSRATIQEIHQLKRELLLLRRAVWPMREVVHTLQREPHECMSDNTRTYLRDVYDHVVQVIDIIETYREIATGLTETYMSSLSHRLNEVMKVLTIIGTIFIPLTFLAGVYGMNFQRMPEIHGGYAYPWMYPLGFWGVCALIAGGLLAFFRRKGWL